MWGDKVLVQHSSTHTYRHDLMRNEIANACRGIRRFSGHTELRVGPHLYTDLTVFAGLGDATFANPLDLDVHIHHLYGQGLLGHLGRDGGSVQALQHLDNAKVAKYGPICNSQGREFPPRGPRPKASASALLSGAGRALPAAPTSSWRKWPAAMRGRVLVQDVAEALEEGGGVARTLSPLRAPQTSPT